ncbi:predicted protein [Clavispora lusitaniae ATCC 42720]|uniref:Uncharacterized protein n=1 Tax=Clavispora lusitaniae (strain ATCC 42720) TaxID=306902 RepID=C4YCI5_CLAL4|nr:uncharacterized protein CLUG_05824 [Clavispora lusitaniae ATCC 42720]EEQ41696.1 predicted protein [Clavispora lusitaniae ATCC 42720]
MAGKVQCQETTIYGYFSFCKRKKRCMLVGLCIPSCLLIKIFRMYSSQNQFGRFSCFWLSGVQIGNTADNNGVWIILCSTQSSRYRINNFRQSLQIENRLTSADYLCCQSLVFKVESDSFRHRFRQHLSHPFVVETPSKYHCRTLKSVFVR